MNQDQPFGIADLLVVEKYSTTWCEQNPGLASDEIERLRLVLHRISEQEYDGGYTAEMIAKYTLEDPKFQADMDQ